MSVNRDDNGQQSSMGQAFASAGEARRQEQPAQQQRNQSTGFSFRNLRTLGNAPMGRSPASEVLVKLEAALAEQYKSVASTFEVKLIPLDMNNNPQIARSALIVTLRNSAAKHLGVAYHALILDGSAEPFPPRYENINGQNVEIMRVAGDVVDDQYRNSVRDIVQRNFPKETLVDAYEEVVPRDFKIEENSSVLYALAANAIFACSTQLEKSDPDFRDINLADAGRDATLTDRVTFGNPQVENPVGEPIRSDVLIEMVAGANQQSQNNQERQNKVSEVRGFLDLIWDPVMPSVNPYAQMNQQQQQFNQLYAAHFIMTDLQTVELLSLPAQLLALLNALMLAENNAWAAGFKPKPYTQGIDIHDIGAIGIEANPEKNPNGIGNKIDTKADSFRDQTLVAMLQAFVRPGLVLSLDVEECGPSSWYNGAFAAVGEGSQRAFAAIYDAANTLTNGNFGKYFGNNTRIAMDTGNRIHTGWYVDNNGVKRDLRDIDYLAIANLVGEKDPSMIREWSDSFWAQNIPAAVRLATRKRILQNLVNPTFTGFARRVTFDTVFLQALAAGAKDAGLILRAHYPYSDPSAQERAVAQYSSTSLMGHQSSGLFNSGFGGVGNAGPGYRSGFSQWR